MKKHLIFGIFLGLCVVFVAFAQTGHLRVIVETSPLARQLLTNDTAASWNAILGSGGGGGVPALFPAQIFVGNASSNAQSQTLTGDASLNTAGVITLSANFPRLNQANTFPNPILGSSGGNIFGSGFTVINPSGATSTLNISGNPGSGGISVALNSTPSGLSVSTPVTSATFNGALIGSLAGATGLPSTSITGIIPTANLGTGTANSSTFLNGANQWVAGTGGGIAVSGGSGTNTSISNLTTTGVSTFGGTNVFTNAIGNAGGLTNINVTNLTGVGTYTSAINTNVIFASSAGSNMFNGEYQFKDVETGSGDSVAVYTNGVHNIFLIYDPEFPVVLMVTNVVDYQDDTIFYEFDGTLAASMQSANWLGVGSELGAVGPTPNPLTQFGITLMLVSAAANPLTNSDIYVDPLNGHDALGSTGPFLQWQNLTNALTFAASRGGGVVHISGTNFTGPIFNQPDNVQIVGYGVNVSAIQMMTNTGDPQINLGNNTVDKGFTVNGYFEVTGISNRFEMIKSIGLIDSLYFQGGWGNFEAWDCEFDSGFDTINATAGSKSTSLAQFHNCTFHALGSLPNNGQDGSGVLRCAAVGNGIFRFYGCSFEASGLAVGATTSQNACLEITGTTGSIYVSGCSFKYDTISGWAHAVEYNGSQGANSNAVFEFDGCIPQGNGTNDVHLGNVVMLGSTISQNYTFEPAGQTGDKTINNQFGSIRIAAAGSSVVLTDILITTNSVVSANLGTVDTTAKSVECVPSTGSCTFTLDAAATSEVEIRWSVLTK